MCTVLASCSWQATSHKVVIGEERACRLCHTRIGTKMFAVYPNGTIVCFRCFRTADAHVDPVSGRNFLEYQAQNNELWQE